MKKDFLPRVMAKPALHIMADPLAGANVMEYRSGEALNWHFDRSEFTTTLLLQKPAQGGEFEYCRDLRSHSDPNYEGVARLLAGNHPEARILELQPGTLNVFRGRNTAHRVTAIQGERERIIAVLSMLHESGIYILQALIRLLTGLNMTDPTSGFRAVNRRVIRAFAHWYPEDYPEPEVILLLKRGEFRIEEGHPLVYIGFVLRRHDGEHWRIGLRLLEQASDWHETRFDQLEDDFLG